MAKKGNSTEVLLEDMRGDIKAILEVVVPTHKRLIELEARYNVDIPAIQADIKVIKAAAIKTNQNVADLDHRLTRHEMGHA